MTPEFTTPCYVRIGDAQQRREVCEKLEQMGFRKYRINSNAKHILLDSGDYMVVGLNRIYTNLTIDCGTNIPLFLDLAGMRNDTLIGQFVNHNGDIGRVTGIENGICNIDFFHFEKESYIMRATATDIIEWHKQKGETK